MKPLSLVLDKYRYHPQFLGVEVTSVNDRGAMDDRPLHIACNARANPNALEDIKELIEHGADVNAQGDRGFTPLHIAITFGTPEVVEVLLKAGARTDIRDADGETVAGGAPYYSKEIREMLAKAKT